MTPLALSRPSALKTAPAPQRERTREEPAERGSVMTRPREDTREIVEPGDHERYSHFVPKEKIVESAVLGIPVTALCGKVWVPSRDPQKFPLCPLCKEIYDGLAGDGDGADGSGKD